MSGPPPLDRLISIWGLPLYSVADGRMVLNLHPGQMRAWASQKRMTMMLAGTQG